MADVNIQQTPEPASGGGGGGSSAGWVVAVLVLVAIVAWFVFGGGLHRTNTYKADVRVSAPGVTGGSAGGDVKGGATKTP